MTAVRRHLVVPLLIACAMVSGLAGAAVWGQRQEHLRGRLNGLPEPTLSPRIPIMGVNADLTQYSPDELEENLALIKSAGFTWVRQVFAWEEIEKVSGTYNWDAYDTIVSATKRHDLELVAVLWGAPDWAAPSPSAPPNDLADFEDFASAVAVRYGDQVHVYQIWDEPNLASGWGGQPVNPIGYARLLETAYRAIHSADSNATVLTAGLAPTTEQGPENLSDVLYLRALYENGTRSVFDGVAAKPYGFDTGPTDRRVSPDILNSSRMVLLREEMERHGDHDKSLWASHFGWNSLPSGWDGNPSVWGQTDPETQASHTVAFYRRALMEWPWTGGLIVEGWQPNAEVDDPRWGFALRRSDGSLSPTYDALMVEAEAFSGVMWPGIYQVQTPLAHYSGQWEFSDLGADFSETASSVVELPFVGDQLGVIVRRDNYRAYLYVTVDGIPPRVLPRDRRGAYLVLTSADGTPRVETIPVATGYGDGEIHRARLEAERGWDQWALAGYVVGTKVNTLGFDISLLVLAGILAGTFGGALWLGREQTWFAWANLNLRALARRMGDHLHTVVSIGVSLAVWLGAALSWGGLVPSIVRRVGDGPSLLATILTAGVFYFSPWLVLTLIALFALFVLIYARLSTGVALIMLFAPYYLLPRPLFDRSFSLVEVISLLTLLAWLLHTVAARQDYGWPTFQGLWQNLTTLDKAVLLFVGIALISLSWADLPGVAVTELRQMILEPAIVYLVLRTTPMSDEERWRIVDLLILTGFIVAGYGFYQFSTEVVASQGFVCLRSVFGTCNNAALFMGRLLPITASILLIGSWSMPGSRARRRLYGLAGLFMIVACMLTTSRGGLLLGIPAGLAAVIILWKGRAGWIAVGLTAALGILALIPLGILVPRIGSLLDLTSETSTGLFRLQLWQSALRMIRDHPITGLGLDQFLYAYRSYYILPDAWRQPDLSQPHNVFLNYWVRLGIIGLAAGLWLQVAFWQKANNLYQRLQAADDQQLALVVGIIGSMAAFLGHGLVDEAHFVIDLAYVFFMSLGMLHQIEQGIRGDASIHTGEDTQAG